MKSFRVVTAICCVMALVCRSAFGESQSPIHIAKEAATGSDRVLVTKVDENQYDIRIRVTGGRSVKIWNSFFG